MNTKVEVRVSRDRVDRYCSLAIPVSFFSDISSFLQPLGFPSEGALVDWGAWATFHTALLDIDRFQPEEVREKALFLVGRMPSPQPSVSVNASRYNPRTYCGIS